MSHEHENPFWSLERVNEARESLGYEALANLCQCPPFPREELATEQQREDMRWLQRGMSLELRRARYWTEEEILDPSMTYKVAERNINYLRNWQNHGVPARFHQLPQLLPRERDELRRKVWLPI